MPATVRRATVADAALLSALNAEVQAIHAAALPGWFKPPGVEAFPPAAAFWYQARASCGSLATPTPRS